MSYHLALRSLQRSCLTPGVGGFVDCIFHSLAGEHPAAKLQLQLQEADSRRLTLTNISDGLSELLAVDLNPVGNVLRLANNDLAYVRTWDFYNQVGNVVAKVGFDSIKRAEAFHKKIASSHISRGEMVRLATSHENVAESYRQVLEVQLRKNSTPQNQIQRIEDSRVSTVARIFGMDALIVELSEYFEAHPKSKVSHACVSLGVHARTAERQLSQMGLTIVMLKRACMLSRATREILWSDRPYSEIAFRSGYTHAAHLGKAISFATGGMSPSFVRSLVRSTSFTSEC